MPHVARLAAPSERKIGRGKSWYVARTQPRRESYALHNLTNQGFEALCPQIERAAPRGPTSVPLFPSYLFVELDLEHDRWRSVNGTRGIIGLVCFGQRPSLVPGEFAKALTAAKVGSATFTFSETFSPGERVRIMGGAFDGTFAEFIEQRSEDRVAILIEMLSGSHPVEIAVGRLLRG